MASENKMPVYRFATRGVGGFRKPSFYPRCPGGRPADMPGLEAAPSAKPSTFPVNERKAGLLPTPGSLASHEQHHTYSPPCKSPTVSCRCQRPQCMIMCSSCGFTFVGRVRSPCQVHPGQIYLMDNESCPSCSASCLREYAIS